MKVLIACEESQRVCTAFRERVHEAYSCDIIEPSGDHPEWRILGDALEAIKGGQIETMDGKKHDIGRWDIIIAHPPCTYLSNAGACRLFKIIDGKRYINAERLEKGFDGRDFFMKFLNADCDKIAVENPIPSRIYRLPKYTQIIEPYQFGHPYTKKKCLWLKNLPPLQPTNIVVPIGGYICGNAEIWKRQAAKGEVIGKEKSAKHRSKTFEGIAKAMAEQWGDA